MTQVIWKKFITTGLNTKRVKSFRDSLSLANFTSGGEFPEYDSDWDQPGVISGDGSEKSDLARKIVERSKGDIKGYYPGEQPVLFL